MAQVPNSLRILLLAPVLAVCAIAAPAAACAAGDLDYNDRVDIEDLAILAGQWLDDPGCVGHPTDCADLDGQNGVNLVDFALFARNWKLSTATVVINEFMASNDETLADEDGDYPDWIEILNLSAGTVDLQDWYLTDNAGELAKWRFPGGVILEPGGLLVVFASGKNRKDDPNYLHTSFQLNRDGEYLALVWPDGSTVEHEFSPTFPAQNEDISYGFKGAETTLIPVGSPAAILIPTGPQDDPNWRGGNEPFGEAGWMGATTGIGFSTSADPDLQAYWAFEGAGSTATDSSNWARDGTIFGASRTGSGKIGSALAFDGYNDYVSINVPGSMEQMTISMWVNFNFISGAEQYDIATPIGHVGEETGAFFLTFLAWGVPEFTLIGPTDEYLIGGTDSVALDTWYHIAVTYDNINHMGRIYFDGKEEGFSVNTVGPALLGNATIGVANNDGCVDGRIDEVAIWSKVLDEEQIKQLAAGASPANLYRYTDLIDTDIGAQMQSDNASAYMRLLFNVPEPNAVEYLTLRMKYDDGFMAWLNGARIAQSNAPVSIQWNSAATASRPNKQCRIYEDFNISPYIDHLQSGTNVLAIQGLNQTAADEDFLLLPELNAYKRFDSLRFFEDEPTPGEHNVAGFEDTVADTKFSPDRGFHDTPFEVAVSCDTEGATIRYTLDYSEPTESHGTIYTGPISITTTTCLRAAAFKTDWCPSNIDTHTYLFVDDVATQPDNPPGVPSVWGHSYDADYEVDPDIVSTTLPGYSFRDAMLSIPTLSLVTETDNLWSAETGIYYNDSDENERAIQEHTGRMWERPTSAELIYPDERAGFQIDAGARIHGDYTRRHSMTPKHSMRLYFRSYYGAAKLDYPLFGDDKVKRFDQLILRGCSSDGWPIRWESDQGTYMRDQHMRDMMADMGQPASHGIYVHLYLNGLYWGLYNLCEKAHNSFWAENFGGDRNEYDVIKDWVELHAGSFDAWSEMTDIADGGLETTEAYQRIQGNNPDGSRNPDYPVYLKVDNLIDYMIAHIHGGSDDWPGHNWWAARRRGPRSLGFMFTAWDQEGICESLDTYGREDVDDPGPAFLYDRCRRNTMFQRRFGDRLHEFIFNDGVLSAQAQEDRWMARSDEIDKAIVGESARWGDIDGDEPRGTPYKRGNEWLDVRNWLTGTYFPSINPVVIERFGHVSLYPNVEAPVFNINGSYRHGGYVPDDASLTMTNPNGPSTIWYTLDGTDPRAPIDEGGDVITFVAEDDAKKVLVPSGNIGTTWRSDPGYDDSAWTHGTPTEPDTTGGVGYETDSGFEDYITYNVEDQMSGSGKNTSCYVRIPFSVTAEDLAGLNFMTLKMRYDDGFVAYINGQEVARAYFTGTPAWDSFADSDERESGSFQDFDVSIHIGELSTGSNILAIHGLNRANDSSDFLASAKLIAGREIPGGPAGTAIQYTGSPITLTHSTNVKACVLDGAEWSALNNATYAIGPVKENLRITEIMYHPTDPNHEFVELRNIGTEAINLNLVGFTDGIDFTFGPMELSPCRHVVVVNNQTQFEAEYGTGANIAGQFTGSLSNAGEDIELEDALGETILDFDYNDDWFDMTDGAGFSLTVRDPNNADPNDWPDKKTWRPSAAVGGSPGWDDTGVIPQLGAVVINELLAHSHAAEPDWIELYNTTAESINIGGWFLSDSDADDPNRKKYEIAEGTTIPQNGYVVFYEDQHFGDSNAPGCNGPFALSENGETLYLQSGQNGELTGYYDDEKFDASETNVAFGRYYKESTGTYNFVAMSENTPGDDNAYPKVGPIVISEIMYHPRDPNMGSPYTDDDDFEYVELHNITGSAVTLQEYDNELQIDVCWRFIDEDESIDFVFPLSTTVPPGGYLLLVKDEDAFNYRYTVPGGAQILEWGDGKCNNGGEKLDLQMPGDMVAGERYYIRIDRVNYSDGSHPEGGDPWPTEPDGTGEALTRKVQSDYGNDVANWQAARPTPGH